MFEGKMIQSSVEPAENKSFSSVDVNCTDECVSLVDDKQTLTSPLCLSYYRHYFHLQLLRACLNLLHPTGKTKNQFGCLLAIFWHKHKSSKQASEVNRTDKENSANIWMVSSFLIGWYLIFALLFGDLSRLFSPLISPFLPSKYATMPNEMIFMHNLARFSMNIGTQVFVKLFNSYFVVTSWPSSQTIFADKWTCLKVPCRLPR